MDARLNQLLEAAFHQGAARDANEEISKTRDEFSAMSGMNAWSYEVLVPKDRGADFLLKDTLPRFTYFLHSHGTPTGAGVFLSLFHGDRLYFVAAADALALLSEWSGLSLDDMKTRWSSGFSQAELFLPGPGPGSTES